MLPAHHIDDQAIDRHDSGVVGRDQHRAARPGFTDVPPLQVARKNDPWIRLQHGVFVHMAQCPVVVAFGVQFGQRARRVPGMRRVAFEGGVQHADVEPARHRIRVADRQVLDCRGVLETAAVQCHAQRLDAVRDGFAGIEHMHVEREHQPPGHLAFSIVVAVEQVDRNAGVIQPPHLAHEEVSGVEVLPVAVVQVARDDEEVDFQVDSLGDQVGKGIARGSAQGIDRCVLVRRQSAQGAVEMDVGGVDEFHGYSGWNLRNIQRRIVTAAC